MASSFNSLAPQIDLPQTEHQILSFWETQDIFQKSVAAREGKPTWTFYEVKTKYISAFDLLNNLPVFSCGNRTK